MMALDLSLYQNFLKPPKTVADYDADARAAQMNMLQSVGALMKMREMQQQEAETNALRGAYKEPGFDPYSEAGQARILQLNPRGGPAMVEKLAQVQKERAQAAHAEQQREFEETKRKVAEYEFTMQRVKMASTPQELLTLIDPMVKKGVIPPDQASAVSRVLLSGDQKTFIEFRDTFADTGMDRSKQVKADLDRKAELRQAGSAESEAQNRDLVKGPDGKYVINQPLQQAKVARASAGASKTQIKIDNFEPFATKLQGQMAEGLAKNYDTLKDIPASIQALDKAKEFAKNNTFVGSAGEQKLAIVKFLNNNLGTTIAEKDVANAETLRTALFTNVLDHLKKLDSQPSQQQQQVLQESMGKLTTDPNALPQIIDFWKGQLAAKAREHNRRVRETESKSITFPYDITIPEPSADKPTQQNPNLTPQEQKELDELKKRFQRR